VLRISAVQDRSVACSAGTLWHADGTLTRSVGGWWRPQAADLVLLL